MPLYQPAQQYGLVFNFYMTSQISISVCISATSVFIFTGSQTFVGPQPYAGPVFNYSTAPPYYGPVFNSYTAAQPYTEPQSYSGPQQYVGSQQYARPPQPFVGSSSRAPAIMNSTPSEPRVFPAEPIGHILEEDSPNLLTATSLPDKSPRGLEKASPIFPTPASTEPAAKKRKRERSSSPSDTFYRIPAFVEGLHKVPQPPVASEFHSGTPTQRLQLKMEESVPDTAHKFIKLEK